MAKIPCKPQNSFKLSPPLVSTSSLMSDGKTIVAIRSNSLLSGLAFTEFDRKQIQT